MKKAVLQKKYSLSTSTGKYTIDFQPAKIGY